MKNRRRLFLLLALLAVTLGVVSLAVLGPESTEPPEQALQTPAIPDTGLDVTQHVLSRDEEVVPPAAGGKIEVSTAPPAPSTPQAPPAPEKRRSMPASLPAGSKQEFGPALVADTTPAARNSEETPSWSGGPMRLASVSEFVAGGGAPRGSRETDAPQSGSSAHEPAAGTGPESDDASGNDSPSASDGKHGSRPGGNTQEQPPGQDRPDQSLPGDDAGDDAPGDPQDKNDPPVLTDPGDEWQDPPVSVPEPGSLALFALGLLGCALRGRGR